MIQHRRVVAPSLNIGFRDLFVHVQNYSTTLNAAHTPFAFRNLLRGTSSARLSLRAATARPCPSLVAPCSLLQQRAALSSCCRDPKIFSAGPWFLNNWRSSYQPQNIARRTTSRSRISSARSYFTSRSQLIMAKDDSRGGNEGSPTTTTTSPTGTSSGNKNTNVRSPRPPQPAQIDNFIVVSKSKSSAQNKMGQTKSSDTDDMMGSVVPAGGSSPSSKSPAGPSAACCAQGRDNKQALSDALSQAARTAYNQRDEEPTCTPATSSSVVKNDNFKWHVPKIYEQIVNANPEVFPGGASSPLATGAYCGLKMTNSLTDDVEPFLPHEGRKVNWYVCGPTVYDHAHLGHARAYLTFDIMRRVMEDYFGYEVLYQLNITDIDDKIILRARKNELLDEYLKKQIARNWAGSATAPSFAEDVQKILGEKDEEYFRAKKEKLVQEIQAQIEAALSKGWKPPSAEEQEEKLQKFELKKKTFLETKEKTEKKLNEKDFAGAADVLADELKDWLDETVGSSVTDNMVFQKHARKFENSFWDDMNALNVRPPDAITRVTEYTEQIVEFIKTMVASGGAYESNGSVYFDTRQFERNQHDYPKLGPKGKGSEVDDDAMQEGEGALGVKLAAEKKDPRDFALWKKSKDGEPRWPSPWGLGRPGWHIECSVMASDLMGARLDIHGGGQDLKFPHHANEMAQSECYHGTKQWCNYWTHAGTLNIEGLKMSKSLKNFFSIKEILEKISPTQLRIAFLQQRWDRKMNYSSDQMLAASEFENRVRAFTGAVKQKIRAAGCPSSIEQVWGKEEKQLSAFVTIRRNQMEYKYVDKW